MKRVRVKLLTGLAARIPGSTALLASALTDQLVLVFKHKDQLFLMGTDIPMRRIPPVVQGRTASLCKPLARQARLGGGWPSVIRRSQEIRGLNYRSFPEYKVSNRLAFQRIAAGFKASKLYQMMTLTMEMDGALAKWWKGRK